MRGRGLKGRGGSALRMYWADLPDSKIEADGSDDLARVKVRREKEGSLFRMEG